MQLREQIVQNELEMVRLSNFKQIARQLYSHNQSQCRELEQLEKTYSCDDELLKNVIAKVETLRIQVNYRYNLNNLLKNK